MKPDGGPAFPCGKDATLDRPMEKPFYYGMSVRTLIAAVVMAGIEANPSNDMASGNAAEIALMDADALIAELEKGEDWESDQLRKEKAEGRVNP